MGKFCDLQVEELIVEIRGFLAYVYEGSSDCRWLMCILKMLYRRPLTFIKERVHWALSPECMASVLYMGLLGGLKETVGHMKDFWQFKPSKPHVLNVCIPGNSSFLIAQKLLRLVNDTQSPSIAALWFQMWRLQHWVQHRLKSLNKGSLLPVSCVKRSKRWRWKARQWS